MISQGSSEHSICCVVRADQAERGRAAIAAAFSADTATGSTQAVSITPDICVLAAVGDGMVGTPGVAARLFSGLAQRSEEHTSELQSLMRISYAVFCLKKKKTNHHTLMTITIIIYRHQIVTTILM